MDLKLKRKYLPICYIIKLLYDELLLMRVNTQFANFHVSYNVFVLFCNKNFFFFKKTPTTE